ncbi:hypothetical protein KUH32_01360 [Thalassococcus sp. CAU 1522]|uniref:Stress-induced protein n=1 Tax=Thalassococcus arenae TaxID=2851652 RepID=A0ABS6N316_9RHOB|nr:hypothetical protein [Thalassococcus arenae]MBV2358409.1 hypothetical protein [Thalassococcus arenae]
MADRHRSKDGRQETREMHGEPGTAGQQGREGGRLARSLGTKDELKRAHERPAGATRVTKSMEKDKEDRNG